MSPVGYGDSGTKLPRVSDVTGKLGRGLSLMWLGKWWRKRSAAKREQFDVDVDRIITQVEGLIDDLPDLWISWRTGNRRAIEAIQPVTARIEVIVSVVTKMHPRLSKEGRIELAVAAILRILKAKGIDLPGPDRVIVEAIVRGLVYTWHLISKYLEQEKEI